MTMQAMPTHAFSNAMGSNLLDSLTEVIGEPDLHNIMNKANLANFVESVLSNNPQHKFHYEYMSKIMLTIDEVYGVHCGQGISLRIGRSFFNSILRDYGQQLGLLETSFRLLPLHKKIVIGLDKLAEWFNKVFNQSVQVTDSEHLEWNIYRCPICWKKHASVKSCAFMVGFLQEAMYWISGGRQYSIEETNCIAIGDATCTIRVKKQPIE